MSETPPAPRAARRAAAALLLLSAAVGCGRSAAGIREAAVIEGEVGRIIRVDSEHGQLNGVFRPEVIYDLYLRVPAPNSDTYQLWVTRDTAVYKQTGGGPEPVPFDTLRVGEQVRAHTGEVDRQGNLAGAYALKIVILN